MSSISATPDDTFQPSDANGTDGAEQEGLTEHAARSAQNWKTQLCSTALDTSSPAKTVWQSVPSDAGLRIKRTPLASTYSTLLKDQPETEQSELLAIARKARDDPPAVVLEFAGVKDEILAPISKSTRTSEPDCIFSDPWAPITRTTTTWRIADSSLGECGETTATYQVTRQGGHRLSQYDKSSGIATLGTVSLSTAGGEPEKVVTLTCSDTDALSKLILHFGWGPKFEVNEESGIGLKISEKMGDKTEAEKLLVLAATQDLLAKWRADDFVYELKDSIVPIRLEDYREIQSGTSILGPDVRRDIRSIEGFEKYKKVSNGCSRGVRAQARVGGCDMR